ncbi:hypothetical protein LINPERHAP1_LOCUS13946 [Linum perenne]
MLLHIVKGCTSFEDIRTVNGKTYDSFKQTCNAHGFLTNDGEWNNCLEEVSFTATAREMRKLFVTMLLYCQVSDVKSLWEKNWTLLSDDILFSRRQELRLPNLELSIEETKILCLLQLQNILRGFGKTLADIQGFPAPPVDSTLHLSNSLLAEEMNYDCAALQAQFQSDFMKLNTKQKAAYDQIMESVETNGHQLFFIDGYGGTGKTFLWQVISMKLRRSELAELLRHTSLIIWYEAPMSHKDCIHSLDRTLRDVMSRNNKDNASLHFGGITIVFGGDFRQILPVIPKATRTEIINSSIKRSYLWDSMNVIALHQNMRLHREG